jgi:hypothetical protein
MKYLVIFFTNIIFVSYGQIGHQTDSAAVTTLRFLGEYVVPFRYSYNSTTIGGLSGIDYHPEADLYYIISDDRGMFGPVRYYTARIDISTHGIDTVQWINVTTLLQKNGTHYQPVHLTSTNNVDPEGIRYSSSTNRLVWISEGERSVNLKTKLIVHPAINISTKEGKHEAAFALPENLYFQLGERGPRQNGTFEGIAFDASFQFIFASIEEPLYEDAARADVDSKDIWTRIYKWDVRTGKNVAQYAYPLEPVAYPPIPADGFRVNGISEILYFAPDQLLVVERSFSSGKLPCTVKVFLTYLESAENIIDNPSLKAKPPEKPMKKTLILNMDDLGIYIDNIEGVSFGPILENGNRTLMFVSDNNFNAFEKTQFLLFEIVK